MEFKALDSSWIHHRARCISFIECGRANQKPSRRLSKSSLLMVMIQEEGIFIAIQPTSVWQNILGGKMNPVKKALMPFKSYCGQWTHLSLTPQRACHVGQNWKSMRFSVLQSFWKQYPVTTGPEVHPGVYLKYIFSSSHWNGKDWC